MIINGNRKYLLGLILTNYVLIQIFLDFFWLQQTIFGIFLYCLIFFFLNNITAKLNALVADICCRTGNQFSHFALHFSAKRTKKHALPHPIILTFFYHLILLYLCLSLIH